MATVQLPGRENRLRERPFDSIGELLPSLIEGIGAGFDRPFALFGHSLGATIAFEVARELRRAGLPGPIAFFASASRAPQLPWPHPPVRHLADLELLAEINRRYRSVPAVVMEDRELRELLTPMLRADMALVETYRYEPEVRFEFPIVAFGGTADTMVAERDIREWREQTTGDFQFVPVQGEHLYLESRREELLKTAGTVIKRGLAARSDRR